MTSKETLINDEEKNSLTPKKLWIAPMLLALADPNNIHGTVGPGSDFGQAPPGTPS